MIKSYGIINMIAFFGLFFLEDKEPEELQILLRSKDNKLDDRKRSI